jgi:hypothetical protein
MKNSLIIAVATAIALAAGCSSMSIHHDIDTTADFSSYRTFCWADSMADESVDESVKKLIESKTSEILFKRGLTRECAGADLLATFHAGSSKKIDVDGYGYSYGGEYSGWQDAGIGIYPYQEGTLVVDLVDARTKKLVWRGAAQGVSIRVTNIDREKAINKALDRMFEDYPPE